MPLYEYSCPACGSHFRRLLPRTITASPPCPSCLSPNPERLFSRFAPLHTEEQLAERMEEQYGDLGESTDPKVAQRLLDDLGSAMGEEVSPHA